MTWWHRIVNCGKEPDGKEHRQIMAFSEESLSSWSSLFLWNNQTPHSSLPPVSNGGCKVSILKGTPLTFMVTSHCALPLDVGEYVGSGARTTTDPQELYQLIGSTEEGRRLHAELQLAYPAIATPRLYPPSSY